MGYSYPTPNNISYLYNYGFLLGMCIVLQIITGICLSMHYISIISYSFFVIKHIIRDIYNGSLLRYLHSNGASFTFMVLYLHICRSIIFHSYILYMDNRYFLIFIFTCDSIFRICITLGTNVL